MPAGGVGDAPLEFGDRADEFDEDHLAAVAGDDGDRAVDKVRAHGCSGRKGEDESRQLVAAGVFEDGEPDLFAQFDEGRAAEVEDGEKQVDGEVIVEELITG